MVTENIAAYFEKQNINVKRVDMKFSFCVKCCQGYRFLESFCIHICAEFVLSKCTIFK